MRIILRSIGDILYWKLAKILGSYIDMRLDSSSLELEISGFSSLLYQK